MKIGIIPRTPENSHSTTTGSSVHSVRLDNTASIVASLFIFNLSGLQMRCHCLCCGLLKVMLAVCTHTGVALLAVVLHTVCSVGEH